MQFQKTLITIAAALAFGAASTTLFATPITTEASAWANTATSELL